MVGDEMTKYIFFSGKGGVGKTTMACATAIYRAAEGNKTLIVSTDPASNLSDVFEQEIGHRVAPIRGVDNLHGMEIDPDEATRQYKERIIAPYRQVMPEDVIASIDEQLSGPCTTEMAAFDRFIEFMESPEYDVIVFDTAPTGHTIRLLELPVDWSRHIEEASRGTGQTCLGPVQTIQDSKQRYDRATALLRDAGRAAFIFVMRPEALSLYETLRASRELEVLGIRSAEVIVNGVLPGEVCDIGFFRKKYDRQQEVIEEIKTTIQKPARYLYLRDGEVKGVPALRSVGRELFEGERPPVSAATARQPAAEVPLDGVEVRRLWLPHDAETKALFFTGKGGVGKTTISCIAALYLANRGVRTLLVTTDPAAHIGEVLGAKVGSEPSMVAEYLFAAMVDQEEAFRQYRERMLGEARGKYSEEMLTAMEEELNSPCTEEMAAFDRFIQFIECRDYQAVVFDTAPTGHTLRLLDLPFDYARQVEMRLGAEGTGLEETAQNRFREIIEVLRDGRRTVFSLVLYPEATPILESYRATRDLKAAGIETQLVIANMVLPEEASVNEFFARRRGMQMSYMKEIRDRFNLPVLRFPFMQEEIKGMDGLGEALSCVPELKS
jgi:arsenite-transporting ATPase